MANGQHPITLNRRRLHSNSPRHHTHGTTKGLLRSSNMLIPHLNNSINNKLYRLRDILHNNIHNTNNIRNNHPSNRHQLRNRPSISSTTRSK
jgi:hypothetical protein